MNEQYNAVMRDFLAKVKHQNDMIRATTQTFGALCEYAQDLGNVPKPTETEDETNISSDVTWEAYIDYGFRHFVIQLHGVEFKGEVWEFIRVFSKEADLRMEGWHEHEMGGAWFYRLNRNAVPDYGIKILAEGAK